MSCSKRSGRQRAAASPSPIGARIGRLILFALMAVAPWASLSADDEQYSRFIAETDPLSPGEQQQKFHLPPGFEIELVASEPQVRKPINLNFDARGRLLVSSSVEYPSPPSLETAGRDTIKRLSDTDGDGRYDTVETLAEGLHIPVGVSPGPRGVLAYSIPHIEQIGADGRREVLFRGFDAADTHGMPSSFTWHVDGWIYGCQGESNVSRVPRPDGTTVMLQGGTTFRMRPDGTRFEIFAHGQVNPFGLCFDPLGNLYTADSHSRPACLLLRGAWYPGLGTAHGGLGFGPAMMRHRHGSTGIAGIAYYAAEQFPEAYRDTLFIGNPVTGRINHDRLEISGSTITASEQPDFLTCDDPWFRPVDVQLGPDGALYVADFYNRIIAHSLVPLGHARRDRQRGRIWRITWKGKSGEASQPAAVPDLTRGDASTLLKHLNDSNLLIRTLATHQLVERIGRPAVKPLQELVAGDSTARQRAHGLWALERLDALNADLVRRLADDPQRLVRVHLMKALAERLSAADGPLGRDAEMTSLIRDRLTDPDAFVRRAAAEALGRHRAADNIRPLLNLWSETPDEDELLIHTVRMALRDNLRDPAIFGSAVKAAQDRPADRQRLADLCLGLPSARSARFLFDFLKGEGADSARRSEFLRHAARYLAADELPQLYEYALTFRAKNGPTERSVLRALYRALDERGIQPPAAIAEWALHTARELIASDDEPDVFAGVELAWNLKLEGLGNELARLAAKSSPHPPLRTFAIDALAVVDSQRASKELAGILRDVAEPLRIRQKAADALGKINDKQSRSILVQHLKVASVPVALVIAQHLSQSRQGAALLLDAVEQGTASARLLQDATVDLTLRSFQLPAIDQRLARLTKNLPPEESRLARVIFQRRAGFAAAAPDAGRGRQIFEKQCAVCHQLDGRGKEVGPDLDGIGLRGVDRLLEDVLNPSRNVDKRFRRSVIVLESGRVLSGLVTEEQGDRLVLVDDEGKPVSIAAGEIEQRRRLPLSPMPANVADKLTEAKFYDLLGYLLQQRQSPPDKPKEP